MSWSPGQLTWYCLRISTYTAKTGTINLIKGTSIPWFSFILLNYIRPPRMNRVFYFCNLLLLHFAAITAFQDYSSQLIYWSRAQFSQTSYWIRYLTLFYFLLMSPKLSLVVSNQWGSLTFLSLKQKWHNKKLTWKKK